MKPQVALWLALLLAMSMGLYVHCILIPYQRSDDAANRPPGANLADLYPRWIGARELLLHHRDPYSPEVTREIQTAFYGHPLNGGRDDLKDEQRFAYPVYVVFLLAPTVGLSFHAVQIFFCWFLGTVTAVSVLLWLRFLRWTTPRTTIAIFLILVLSSPPVIQGLRLQQLSLLVSGLIAGAAALLVGGHLFMAGSLLALATIKPQMAVLPLAWLMLWSLTDWRSRRGLLWGFVSTMALLVGAGEFVSPGWIGKFGEGILAYRRYTHAASLLDALVTPPWGTLLSVLAVLSVSAVCWRLRREPADSPEFALALALVLAVSVLVVPIMALHNQILLLPSVFLLIRSRKWLWRRNWLIRGAYMLAGAVVFWPWLAALGLALAYMVRPETSRRQIWALPLYPSLLVPLFVFGLVTVLAKTFTKNTYLAQAPQR